MLCTGKEDIVLSNNQLLNPFLCLCRKLTAVEDMPLENQPWNTQPMAYLMVHPSLLGIVVALLK